MEVSDLASQKRTLRGVSSTNNSNSFSAMSFDASSMVSKGRDRFYVHDLSISLLRDGGACILSYLLLSLSFLS